MTAGGHAGPRSGEFFAPLPLAALALTVANDIWLKPAFHSELTGKLSDVGICFFMPLFLSAGDRPALHAFLARRTPGDRPPPRDTRRLRVDFGLDRPVLPALGPRRRRVRLAPPALGGRSTVGIDGRR